MTGLQLNNIVARNGVFAEFNGYKIVPIYKKDDTEAQKAVVNLWLTSKILNQPKAAEERSKQVLFMIISPRGELVGVNTVYVSDFSTFRKPAPEGAFYFYRMFIRGEDRIPRMSFKVLDLTYDYLSSFPAGNPRPQGVVLVTENPKLKKPGAQRLLQRMGWEDIGRNDHGQIIMKRDFPAIC